MTSPRPPVWTAFALPFDVAPEDHEQILTDIATHLGPALGWVPTS